MLRPSARVTVVAMATVTAAFALGCNAPPADDEEIEVPTTLEPWAKSFSGVNQPSSLASGPGGDVLIGGIFHGGANFGGGVLTAEPEGSVFLAHLDAEGNHLFSGSTGANDSLGDVAIGHYGDLYATGTFNGPINFGSGKLAGENDGYLAAFDRDGASRFSHAVGGASTDWLRQIAALPNGDVVVSGGAADDVDLGGGAPSSTYTQTQSLVVSYDRDGGYLWEARIDGYVTSDTAVAADKGGVVVAGTTYDTIEIGGKKADNGLFVASLDGAGKARWITASSNDQGNAPYLREIAVGADGAVFASGFYYGDMAFGDIAAPYANNQNGFVVKLSASGVPEWIKAFDATGAVTAPDIAVAPNGDLLLGVTAYQKIDFGGGPIGNDENSYSGLIARFNAKGEHLKSMAFAGTAAHYLVDVAADPTGKPVVLGTFHDTIEFGDTTLTSPNQDSDSTYVVRLDF